MPVFRIETNQALTGEQTQELLEKSTDMLCRVLNKPKTFMMIYIDSGCSMMFNGTTDPFVFVQLRLFKFPEEEVPGIIKNISEFIEHELDVKPNRQYIQLTEMKNTHFGWDGKPC